MQIRAVRPQDRDAVWAIMEPIVRAGETYALPRELEKEAALGYWYSPEHEVFVADDGSEVVGTYYLKANQKGGGSHVANCGFMTAASATGKGVARAMCEHSLGRARERGFRAMQFNLVVSTNNRAVRLWKSFGFETVGRVPGAFLHPEQGYVDALIMYLPL